MVSEYRSVPGVRASALKSTQSVGSNRQSGGFEPGQNHNSLGAKGHTSFAHWLMMACCVAMVAGVALLIIAAPKDATIPSLLWAAAPLLACLGMHVVMHKFMGHSGHSNKSKKDSNG